MTTSLSRIPTNITPIRPATLPQPDHAVEQRAEWAIQLPKKTWWRKLSLRLADPDGNQPSVFHSRGRAEDELADLIGHADDVYGMEEGRYLPQLMVRNVQITRHGVTTGEWRPATALTDTPAR